MNIRQWLQADHLPIPLIALLILTRFHHFGDALHLPDSSLAVFFFAGFYRFKALLGFLIAAAFLIDYVAIRNGTSAFCVSPAYIFLIPTYVVMWLTGRYCIKFNSLNFSELAVSIALLAMATSVAFVISNGSFYLLSGRIEVFSWSHFASQFGQYYPSYIDSTLSYGLAGFLIATLFKLVPLTKQDQIIS